MVPQSGQDVGHFFFFFFWSSVYTNNLSINNRRVNKYNEFSAYGRRLPGRAPRLLPSTGNVFLACGVSARLARSKPAMGRAAFRSTYHVPCQADQSWDFGADYKGKWLAINKRMWNWSCWLKEPRTLARSSRRLPRCKGRLQSRARAELAGVSAPGWGEREGRSALAQALGSAFTGGLSAPAVVLVCF